MPETNELKRQTPDARMSEVHVPVKDDNNAEDDESNADHPEKMQMIYRVQDVPPIFMWPIYGIQQTYSGISGSLSMSFLVSFNICAAHLPEVRAQLLSIAFFMVGVSTLLQSTVGIRLPILQGASVVFLTPILAMMQLDAWKCPPRGQALGPDEDEPWMVRMREDSVSAHWQAIRATPHRSERSQEDDSQSMPQSLCTISVHRRDLEIQGNLLLASITQVLLGCTGLAGMLLRFIGPMTIGPTIAFIGMGLVDVVIRFASKHWGVTALTAALVLLFSQFLGRLQVPVPSYSKDRGCHFTRFRIFVVLSVLLSMAGGWLFCLILTETDVFPNNSTELAYKARTDINLKVLENAPWFRFPYPFQFGLPTVSVAGFFGMFLATLSSILDSLGDYYACAKISSAPPPPAHAVNRGIAIEGFSSIISSLVGAGHATTSYSGNIAAIAVTRVASRRVFQTTGVLLILFGVFNKFGAFMAMIPEPVIGGLNAVFLGTLISVGISTLHYVNLESPRNVTVIGMTFMLGLCIPQWVNSEAGKIETGNEKADQVLNVMLGTPMFVAAIVAALLDNIIPGTLEERGITKWRHETVDSSDDASAKTREDETAETYDLPYVSNFLRRVRCCAFVPIFPSFKGISCRKRKTSRSATTNGTATMYDNKAFNSGPTKE